MSTSNDAELSREKNPKAQVYPCPNCAKMFSHQKSVYAHQRSIHNIQPITKKSYSMGMKRSMDLWHEPSTTDEGESSSAVAKASDPYVAGVTFKQDNLPHISAVFNLPPNYEDGDHQNINKYTVVEAMPLQSNAQEERPSSETGSPTIDDSELQVDISYDPNVSIIATDGNAYETDSSTVSADGTLSCDSNNNSAVDAIDGIPYETDSSMNATDGIPYEPSFTPAQLKQHEQFEQKLTDNADRIISMINHIEAKHPSPRGGSQAPQALRFHHPSQPVQLHQPSQPLAPVAPRQRQPTSVVVISDDAVVGGASEPSVVLNSRDQLHFDANEIALAPYTIQPLDIQRHQLTGPSTSLREATGAPPVKSQAPQSIDGYPFPAPPRIVSTSSHAQQPSPRGIRIPGMAAPCVLLKSMKPELIDLTEQPTYTRPPPPYINSAIGNASAPGHSAVEEDSSGLYWQGKSRAILSKDINSLLTFIEEQKRSAPPDWLPEDHVIFLYQIRHNLHYYANIFRLAGISMDGSIEQLVASVLRAIEGIERRLHDHVQEVPPPLIERLNRDYVTKLNTVVPIFLPRSRNQVENVGAPDIHGLTPVGAQSSEFLVSLASLVTSRETYTSSSSLVTATDANVQPSSSKPAFLLDASESQDNTFIASPDVLDVNILESPEKSSNSRERKKTSLHGILDRINSNRKLNNAKFQSASQNEQNVLPIAIASVLPKETRTETRPAKCDVAEQATGGSTTSEASATLTFDVGESHHTLPQVDTSVPTDTVPNLGTTVVETTDAVVEHSIDVPSPSTPSVSTSVEPLNYRAPSPKEYKHCSKRKIVSDDETDDESPVERKKALVERELRTRERKSYNEGRDASGTGYNVLNTVCGLPRVKHLTAADMVDMMTCRVVIQNEAHIEKRIAMHVHHKAYKAYNERR